MQIEPIWLSANQILEKLIRLSLFVDECELDLPVNRRPSLLDSLRSQVSSHVSDLIRLCRRFSKFKTVDDRTIVTTWGSLQEIASEFQQLHQSLRWLSRPWVSEQTYSFLDDLFRESNAKATLNGTLAYIHLYNWTYNITVHYNSAAPVRTIAWALPCAERHNPLMWPIILHEVGHEISSIFNIDTEVAEALALEAPQASDLRWIEEFTADCIATQLGGPAYFCSLLNLAVFFLRDNLRNAQENHPPAIARLELVKRQLATMKIDFEREEREYEELAFFDELLGERKRIDRMLREYDHEVIEAAARKADHISRTVEAVIAKRNLPLPIFPVSSYKNAKILANKLIRGQMVASRREETAEVTVTTALKSFRSGKLQAADLLSAFSCLNEIPARSGEIITAGWIYKARTTPFLKQQVDDGSLMSNTTEKVVEDYKNHMQEFDTLLEKSLEVSAIHSVFVAQEG